MTTLSSVLAEATRLVVRSGRLWARLWPQLIALMLLGWVGYYSSLLAASEVGVWLAWLAVPVFALGLVALLATTVVALRMVASELGVTEMVRRARHEANAAAPDGSEAEDEPEDDTLAKLLILTLLPFLAVYAAFGYVEDLTTQLVLVSSQRAGLGENLLVALNPTASRTAMLVTLGALVGLYVLRRLVDLWYEHTRWRLLGLLTAFIEACFLFLLLLGGFRLVEQVGLWLRARRLLGWWDAGVDSVAAGLSVFRIDLPEILFGLGEFVSEVLWPVFWEGLTQPIAWLTLAALVFGSRVLSVAELWRTGQPLSSRVPGAQHLRITRRLQHSAAEATGTRRVLLHAQEAFFGDIDDKYLPTFQSVRLMLRAGIVFLGGYVIAFTAVQLLAAGIDQLVYLVVGGRPGSTWIALMPFVDLPLRVLAMSLQVTLLAVAFARVLSIFSERAEQPVPVPAGPVRVGGRWNHLGQAGVVALCCLVLALGTVQVQQLGEFRRLSATVGEAGPLMGRQVVVEAPRYGQRLTQEAGPEEQTELAFVVVRAAVSCEDCPAGTTTLRLVSGEREYAPQFGVSSLLSEDGFRNELDFVFEVDPRDIGPDLRVEASVVEFISGYQDVLDVDLEVDDAAAEQIRTELVGTEIGFDSLTVQRGMR